MINYQNNRGLKCWLKEVNKFDKNFKNRSKLFEMLSLRNKFEMDAVNKKVNDVLKM